LATPKREKKIRDAEATKRALLDAVGEILREQGFSSLTTNSISRWIGKDKNLIRYYFDGLANLKKLYIKEQDYWPKFFEKFQLDESADDSQIRQMFTKMMQENFVFFENSQEMQKIILWQISQENPLMRTISESREEEKY
jgi:AcrR family transcriptional regulator